MLPNKNFYASFLLSMLLAFVVIAPKTALSQVWPLAADISEGVCASSKEVPPEITQLRDNIAGAKSIDEARTLALAPTDSALGALKNARTLMPFSEDLQTAETRLTDARHRIETADTPKQAADEFSGMMVAWLDDDRPAHVKVGKASCNYSTGESIAIVLGLILGIIPGLILLVLLC
jgi:hypothetical protein